MREKKRMSELGRMSADQFRNSPKTPIWIVLDNVRSGLNVGSIFRTADAFSAEYVYCCGITPAPPQRDVLKSALGATETVPFKVFPSTMQAIEALKKEGIQCFAVEQTSGSIPLTSVPVLAGQNMALIFGNEVHGVDQQVIDACYGAVEIEQTGTKHSLNVSVCAGILIHHLHLRFRALKMQSSG